MRRMTGFPFAQLLGCPALWAPVALISLTGNCAEAVVGGREESGVLAQETVLVGICSGVIIAPDVVLSAAHCAAGQVQWRDEDGSRHTAETQAIALHPAFSRQAAEASRPWADLVLLKLEAELPPPLRPARLAQARLRDGELVTLSGYGESVPGDESTRGILRSADLPVFGLQGRRRMVRLEGAGRAGACKGDSGGPITRNGIVLALATAIAGACGHQTRGITLGPQRPWIDTMLARWGRKAAWVDR